MSQYCTASELKIWGLAESGIGADVTDAELDHYLQAASELADSYLANRRYVLPLTQWGNDLRSAVARIAAWNYLTTARGIDPVAGGHSALEKNHDAAIAWLRDVSKGIANLNVAATSPVRKRHAVPQVISDDYENGEKTRGW